MATEYHFTVHAHLDTRWLVWFDGFTITNMAGGQALLAGPIADQAALYGVLVKIRDLGLPLVSVVPANDIRREPHDRAT
jgi:hypothetical protein